MSMYDENHYNIVISLQLIKINEKKEKNYWLIEFHVILIFLMFYILYFFKNVFNFKKKLFKNFF